METIAKIVYPAKGNPQESKSSGSDTIHYRLHGKDIDASNFDSNRFWKNEFLNSFKEVEPHFVIDDRNRELIRELYKWAWRNPESIFDTKKGLLLWGPLGVGKSVLIQGLRIFEAKINKYCFGYTHESLGFALVSAAEISLRYAEKGVDAIIKYSGTCKNLAIDEVGREPTDSKHYGTNVNPIQLVLQLRYENRNQGITHITTNLNPNTQFDVYGEYIVDRLKEMFNVIHINGDSRR